MAEDNTIRINPTKASTLEFDVTISGLENITPNVRFVIEKANDTIDWMTTCSKLEGSQWQASFPAFKNFKLTSCKFRVEVIVDEYYFCPANGIIEFVNAPDVSFKSKTNKPSVSASFKVKQEDEPVKPKKETKKKVSEAMNGGGGGEVTGQYAPTNDLLKPEEDPTDTHGKVKVPQAELDDQFINKARLGEITDEEPTPGTGAQYPQSDGKDEDELDDEVIDDIRKRIAPKGEFDPKRVAEDILQSTMGKVAFPNSKGSLFRRDADGKPIVPGLETNKQLQEKAEKEQRVKDILKQ